MSGLPRLTANAIEAANRGEATAILIRLGYRVYRPEADIDGEDLILRRPDGDLIAVQLKGRLTVDWLRYGAREIWMLFADVPWTEIRARQWFLVPHDTLFAIFEEKHGHTKSFVAKRWSGSKPTMAEVEWLSQYRLERNHK